MLSSRGQILWWSTLDSAISYNINIGNKGVILFSMGPNKGFAIQLDRSSVSNFPSNLCLCEVVVDNSARPFMDFDGDVSNVIDDISSHIKSYIKETYYIECEIAWKWSDGIEGKRWHCVISGMYFSRCWKENNLIMAENVMKRFSSYNVDMGIYRSNSTLRMVGQFKYKNGSYCRRLYPYTLARVETFSIYELGDKKIETCTSPPNVVEDKIVYINSMFTIPQGLIVDRVIKSSHGLDVILLRRIHSSMCIVCNRIHDSIGAYVLCKHGRTEYICYRDRSKTLMFS